MQAVKSSYVKGPKARLPRMPNRALVIKVRDRHLLLKNRPPKIVLAIPEDPPGLDRGKRILKFVIRELRQDVEHLKALQQEGPSASQESAVEPPDREVPAFEEALKTIKAHKQCKKANWLQSRQSFRVTNKGGKDPQ